jgi:hypothetical protein
MHDTLFPLAIKIRYDKLDVPARLFSSQALLLEKLLRHAHEYAKIYLILYVSAVAVVPLRCIS